jgi:hypothetical protein
MILAPPAGDAFTFGKSLIIKIVMSSAINALDGLFSPQQQHLNQSIQTLTRYTVISLKTYPESIFHFALAIGLYIVRHRRKRLGRQTADYKSWHIAVVFFILIQLYILATPWIPPEARSPTLFLLRFLIANITIQGGPYAGEVSFWYATYCVVGIAILILCGLYYALWMYVLPRFGKYAIRPEIVQIDNNGAATHRLVQIPLDQIGSWDAEHDEAGNLRHRHVSGNGSDDLADKY